jgi:hypothetical protein
MVINAHKKTTSNFSPDKKAAKHVRPLTEIQNQITLQPALFYKLNDTYKLMHKPLRGF